ncbi:AEC family transporter [Methanolapillus millepedarum]|uniref:AEC family transporter n=1 Tax=Methanolapillus millepedarum TaxID=3028296 RepID=A0AA96VG20_9EURY|nr:hypothetical protein MsAc7_14880 [Methanosarcinaceae archaeon Ac7]
MDIIYIIVILILLGFLLKYLGILSEKDKVALNNIVINVAIPATLFLSLLTNVKASDLSSYFKLTLFILIISLVCAGLSYLIGKALKMDLKSLAAFILVSCCGNTAFMGFAVCSGFYGVDGFVRAIFCDTATLFLIIILGTYLGIKVSGQKVSFVKQIVKFPPMIAWVVTIILVILGFQISMLPTFVAITLGYLSGLMVPLIMISLGLSLSPKYLKVAAVPAILVTAIQLFFAPVLGIGLSHLFSFAPLDRNVAVIESAMPPAMTPLVFSEIYGMNSKLISGATFLATVVSLVSIPALHLLLEAGLI